MDVRSILMGFAFALMWSSAFASARIIVAQAPPLGSLALRFLASGIIGVGIAFALGQRARLSRAQWRSVVVFGICQNALYLGFNFVAMQEVQASFAAIIASVMPLLVALAGWVIFREKQRPLAVVGLVAGFIGVAIIMGARLDAGPGGGATLRGAAFCIIGVVSLAAATLAVRGASGGGNLLMVVGLQMFVGSAVLAVPAAFETWDVTLTPSLIVAFAYTTLVPGLLATFVWFTLVDRIGAVRAATFHFLNPFFGVLVAAVVLGERITARDVLGVAIIAGGILAVQLSRVRR